MSPKELKRIFHRGNCLSLETMRLYNEGNLPSKTAHAVEEHLLECALCASAIDGLNKTRINDVTRVSENINKRLAVYMNTPPQTPVLSRFGIAVIVSSLALLATVSIWWLASGEEVPSQELADSGAVTSYQPPANTDNSQQDLPENSEERSQDNGAVSVQENSNVTSPQNKTPETETTMENLPATQPGEEKALTVDPEVKNDAPPPVTGDNTREVAVDPFLRIKSVIVYPPTTHTDKKPKSNGGNSNGQLDRTENTKGQFELDEMPTYPGGNEALKNYILTNYQPQKEDKATLKRKTTGVMFQVNVKTGEVSGASLSFPISPLTDAELLRVISAMPKWDPGTKRGTVDVMVGITFE